MLLTVEDRDQLFNIILGLSDRAFDDSVKPRLRELLGKPNEEIKDKFLGLIDDCVYSALTSDLVIDTMHHIWLSIGGSEEELNERNKQLNDPDKRQELQDRFGWKR